MEKLRIGITQGDINGVGYEVILKSLEDNRMLELMTPVIYGSARVASAYNKMLGLPQVPLHQIAKGADAVDGANNIVNVIGEDVKAEPGVATAESGRAALAALEAAVTDLRAGVIDALVTAPINKATIQSETFTFAGHTEYLAASLSEDGRQPLMVLCAGPLRVALTTVHVPLARVSEKISVDGIVDKLVSFRRSLQRDFGIEEPRIGVLALNPHAGEDGLLGTEEQTIITPAIEAAQARKVLAFGPYAADGFWGSGAYTHFDGVLAMYHDQGLAPFKTLAMDAGVNFTANLPQVRTSPDHGTAYDIAGKGEADPESMRQAIYSAIDLVRQRRRFDQARRHSLRKQYYEKGSDNVVLDLTKDDE